jgi:hypothetical protein
VADNPEVAQISRAHATYWVIRLLARADGSLEPSGSRPWRYAMSRDWRPVGQRHAGGKP